MTATTETTTDRFDQDRFLLEPKINVFSNLETNHSIMDLTRRNNSNHYHLICWKPGNPIINKLGPGSNKPRTFLCVELLVKWRHIIVATLLCSAEIENLWSMKRMKNDVWCCDVHTCGERGLVLRNTGLQLATSMVGFYHHNVFLKIKFWVCLVLSHAQ